MDLLKKETSEAVIVTPGIDHEKHSEEMIKNIAGKTGLSPDQLIPAAEKADALIKTQTENFIEVETPDQSSDLSNLGKKVGNLLPEIGESDSVETAPGGEFIRIQEEKKAA